MVGVPEAVLYAVRRWAVANAKIQRIWLFGSRARGTHRIDSDVDLAVAIEGWDSADADRRGEALVDWICCADVWRRQLASISPLDIDLDAVSCEDEVVLPAVLREGVLIYQR